MDLVSHIFLRSFSLSFCFSWAKFGYELSTYLGGDLVGTWDYWLFFLFFNVELVSQVFWEARPVC